MAQRVLLIKIDKKAGGPQRLSLSEPIGICYISAYLMERGIESRVLHLFQDNIQEKLYAEIEAYKPNFIGFSVRNFNFNISCRYISDIQLKYEDSFKFCIGGECISWQNARDLAEKANADLTVVSDGEEATFAYISGQSPETIPGIVFRTSDNQYVKSNCPPKRLDPASIARMDRNNLPMLDYSSEAFPGKRYATMHGQRGCRYKCTFCHTANRYKSPVNRKSRQIPASRTHDQIMEEIDYLTVNHRISTLSIWDEDFFSDVYRVKRLANSLIERGTPVQWQTFMKLTDLKNRELLKILALMRKSGYVRAVIGLESFIPRTLKYYHKVGGPNVEESLKHLSDQGIKVCPSYIIGEPDETEEEIAYGLYHLLKLPDRGIDIYLPYVSFITPFPGTYLYDAYVSNGQIIDENWDHYDGENVVVKSKCPPERLLELRDKFYRDFYGA